VSEMRPLGRSGITVGSYAFGTAQIGNLYHAVSEEQAAGAVDAAWEGGVRYFDSAPHYGLGLAETRLGSALASRPRAEYILSTKVGRALEPNPLGPQPDTQGFDVVSALQRRFDFSRDGVLRSIEESLDRLQTDRIDIVYVHDPDEHLAEALAGAFPALEQLRSEGVIRSYGAGMNQGRLLAEIIARTDADVVMCAGRLTLVDQSALDELVPLAIQREVSIVAAAPFNSGVLATSAPSPDARYDYTPVSGNVQHHVEKIRALCKFHNVSLPAAALQFALRISSVGAVCVGADSAEQTRENLARMHFPIPKGFWFDLAASGLVRGKPPARVVDIASWD
jgi:D-threo-aldose 1-dehydrogenase